MQTRAIVEFGDLDLNRAMRLYGWVGDLAVYRGRYFPSKAPLMSFAAVPVYAGLRALLGGSPHAVPEMALVYFARLLLTVLPTLFVLIWVRRFLFAFVSPATADIVVVTYALGTLAFSYALLFMSHQPTAVFLFASFYGLWRWSRDEWSNVRLLLSGAFAGAAVAAEYTSAIGVLCLCLFGCLALRAQRRSLSASVGIGALFVAGAFPIVLLVFWYHATAFGGPFETGYRHLADAAYQPWHVGGFLGVGLPNPRALALSFFSPLRGLFMLSPALMLAFCGMPLLISRSFADQGRRQLAWLTFAITLSYTYFTAAFSYASWGWTTGPRHLTGLVPFLLLPLALALERVRLGRMGTAAAAFCASSVLITSAVTFINYIPDDVSNAIIGLATPLTQAGDLVPSLLCFFGLPNPFPGALLWICVLSVVAWILWAMRPNGSFRATAAALVVGMLVIVINLATYANSPSDRAALSLLERVWLAPPGRVIGWSSH